MKNRACIWSVLVTSVMLAVASSDAATFQSLPDTVVNAVSNNGTYAAGRYTDGGAFVWSLPGGFTDLDLPPDTMSVSVSGVADSGNFAAVTAVDASSNSVVLRWSTTEGYEPIYAGVSAGISANGSVVAGWFPVPPFTSSVYKWTEGSGLEFLGNRSQLCCKLAFDLSADGSALVGQGSTVLGTVAARSSGTGFGGLGDLAGGSVISAAYGVSADGTIVVGRASTDDGSEAFRWTTETQMVGIGELPGGDYYSNARAVSADGIRIVGESATDLGNEAFLWEDGVGVRRLYDVLADDYGLASQLSGWTLTGAADISGDGRTIVGNGINPDGHDEGWIAVLTPVIELPGDFNHDGRVDAADYSVWRDGLGTKYTEADYEVWVSHFGQVAEAGSGSALPSAEPLSATIPEPATMALFVWGMMCIGARMGARRRRQIVGLATTATTAAPGRAPWR